MVSNAAERMNLPIAPLAAAVIGVAAAAAMAALPAPALEGLVLDSGIAALLPAAEPPLGLTARLAVAAGVGALAALFSWFALFILIGTRAVALGRADPDADEAAEAAEPVPVLRRADAHPDAPPRPPLRATRDLGTPFLEVHARLRKGTEAADAAEAAPAPEDDELVLEVPAPADAGEAPMADAPPAPAARPVPELMPEPMAPPVRQRETRPAPAEAALPDDLDRPLSAYDPAAIPEHPIEAPRRLAPLRRKPRPAVFDAEERFETFELTPTLRGTPEPPVFPVPAPAADAETAITRPDTDATIHALLDRLERGVVRRGLVPSGTKAEAAPEAPPPPVRRDPEHGLQDALVTLRNLARRA